MNFDTWLFIFIFKQNKNKKIADSKNVMDMYDINILSKFARPKTLFVKNQIVILLTKVNIIITKKPTIHLNDVIFSHISYFRMYAPNKYTIISQMAE